MDLEVEFPGSHVRFNKTGKIYEVVKYDPDLEVVELKLPTGTPFSVRRNEISKLNAEEELTSLVEMNAQRIHQQITERLEE